MAKKRIDWMNCKGIINTDYDWELIKNLCRPLDNSPFFNTKWKKN
ncbi:Uncharacterised protein [uncultured archaeon]|nr:Uncharacterised protein [uncultured archaeon]